MVLKGGVLMLATRIKAYIDERGIKQSAVAAAAEMPPDALSRTLSGNRTMTADELVLICKFLRVPVETFVK